MTEVPRRLPKSVYVRRRITVLAALLALIAIIVMLILGPTRVFGWFSGEDSGASQGNQQDAAASSSEPGTNSPETAVEESREPGPCAPERIGVEAVTNQDTYASGEKVQLSIRVTNHDEIPCDIDLGSQSQLFQVTSGAELYWDSRHCQQQAESLLVRMEAGQTLQTEPLSWDGTRSAPETCEDPDSRPKAPRGGASYHLNVEIGGVEAFATKQFILY